MTFIAYQTHLFLNKRLASPSNFKMCTKETLLLFEFSRSQSPGGDFDLAHLCKIHLYVFQDVDDLSGQVRSVDIFRGESRF
jgi:fido (protein-threonine AMPylation protein)